MTGGRAPLKFGGPAGLAALAAVSGLVGLFAVQSGRERAPAAAETKVLPSPPKPKPTLPKPAVQPEPSATGAMVPAPPPPPSRTDPELSVQPASMPTSPSIKPKRRRPLQTVQPAMNSTVQPAVLRPAGDGPELSFIVRIKGSELADAAAKAWHKDPESAQEMYRKLVAERPGLKPFRLIGATYSGELLLGFRLGKGEAADAAAIDKVKQKLLTVKGVAYADPDAIAHPGKGESP